MVSMNSEIIDNLKKIALKETELVACKNILDVVEECTSSDDFDPDLRNKINCIHYSEEVSPFLKISSKYGDENLLGISLEPTELTNEERQKLNRVVHTKLLTGTLDSTAKMYDFSRLNSSVKYLLDLKVKLIETQQRYCENLNTHQRLLENVLRIKLGDSKTLVDKKIESSELASKTLRLKTDILRQKPRIMLFTEIPMALQAYKTAFDDISAQQNKYKQEIGELTELKQKYKAVSCKQFDEILNSYRSYKNALEKKKEIFDKIK